MNLFLSSLNDDKIMLGKSIIFRTHYTNIKKNEILHVLGKISEVFFAGSIYVVFKYMYNFVKRGTATFRVFSKTRKKIS